MELDASLTEEELKVFLMEADEQIQLLDEEIVRLEKEGEDPDILQEIFRAAHTLKGSSAMVGHQRMADLTHVMESLLDKLRKGELQVSTEIIDALLYSLDALKILKDEIVNLQESDLDIDSVVEKLKEAAGADDSPVSAGGAAILTLSEADSIGLQTALAKGLNGYKIKVSVDKNSDWAAARCFQVITELNQSGEIICSSPSADDIEEEKIDFEFELLFASLEDKDTLQGIITSIAEIDNVEIAFFTPEESAVTDKKQAQSSPEAGDRPTKTADKKATEKKGIASQENVQSFQSVRIDVNVLDNLMNIVEELVIDRSMIGRVWKILESRHPNDEDVQKLGETSNHIIKVINELQENIMQVRMVPIGTIFSRFPRLVRDLAQSQKKKLDFIIEGEKTELDRSIIEQVRDPLIHLLRNAVDHGVESPDERKAADKPETATVRLSAYHEQSHIVITLEDDGSGIDAGKVKDGAVRKGLISTEAAGVMTEAEVINLIFAAGMSTTEKATEVSGRGVGLDIVRSNVENLGGSVSLSTEVGVGTKFTIRLPLTVAIIQGLLVSSCGVTYAIPLSSVTETLLVEPSAIQTIGRKEIFRSREDLIPLWRLNATLDGKRNGNPYGDTSLVVVVKAGDWLVGIVVDTLMEQQEIVVKSIGDYLGDIEGIAGATILGDGQVALILDIASLARMAMRGGSDIKKQKSGAAKVLSMAAA
ncbi:MAG: chemotaxis protein CheA [Dehalococcoidales bacterium]